MFSHGIGSGVSAEIPGRRTHADGGRAPEEGRRRDAGRTCTSTPTRADLPLAFDVSRFTLGGFNYQGVARLRPGVADRPPARTRPA
jgi:hypothetical protein